MQKYKYFNKFTQQWEFTDNEVTAKNHSYYSQIPYKKEITTGVNPVYSAWFDQEIPYKLDLSNTDTFHLHEAKGARNV